MVWLPAADFEPQRRRWPCWGSWMAGLARTAGSRMPPGRWAFRRGHLWGFPVADTPAGGQQHPRPEWLRALRSVPSPARSSRWVPGPDAKKANCCIALAAIKPDRVVGLLLKQMREQREPRRRTGTSAASTPWKACLARGRRGDVHPELERAAEFHLGTGARAAPPLREALFPACPRAHAEADALPGNRHRNRLDRHTSAPRWSRSGKATSSPSKSTRRAEEAPPAPRRRI